MAHMRQLPAAFSVLFGTVMGADVKTLLENDPLPEQNAPRKFARRLASAGGLLR